MMNQNILDVEEGFFSLEAGMEIQVNVSLKV